MIWKFLLDHNIVKSKDDLHNAILLSHIYMKGNIVLTVAYKQQQLAMKNPRRESNTKQDIISNRHPDTWGINFYIKLCSKLGSFTTSFPPATFIYPFFSPYILLQDWKELQRICSYVS